MTSILVIDDDENVGLYLRKCFTGIPNVNITFSSTKTDILNKITEDYDLVLCDIAMPGMNGMEVKQKIRDIGKTYPVIAMSNYDEQDKHIKEYGFNGFIRKPFSRTVLSEELSKIGINIEIKNVVKLKPLGLERYGCQN